MPFDVEGFETLVGAVLDQRDRVLGIDQLADRGLRPTVETLSGQVA